MEIRSIPLQAIKPNPQQPRARFESGALQELADSIRVHGLEQPIKVTPNGGPDSYIIVDGERRWQAARIAGLKTITAIVEPKKTVRDMAEAALVANLHRADLNAIEEARAYQNLIDLGLPIKDIAQRVGKSVTSIYTRLQWLKLEIDIQELVMAGQLQGDVTVAAALLKLPAGETRVALATKLSVAGASIKAIVLACDKWAANLAARQQPKAKPPADPHPMSARAIARAGQTPDDVETYAIAKVRAAAQTMCAVCDIRTDVLRGQVGEPAWTLITHAADTTCASCNVREIRGACDSCPGVELLRRMIAPEVKPHGKR